MATYLVDASALMKRYCSEDMTDQVNAVLDDDAHQKVALEITVVETLRNLHRWCNEHSASLDERRLLVARLSADVQTGLLTVLVWDSVYALRAQDIAENAMVDQYQDGRPSPIDLVVAGCALEYKDETPELRVLSCDSSLNQLLGRHSIETEPPMQ